MTLQLRSILLLLCFPILLFAQENSPIACSDGIDNDGDGLIDCADSECSNLPNDGCITCFEDGLSFADFVIAFNAVCTINTHANPETALGVSDYITVPEDTYLSLGEQGSIELGFSNNLITNSGDNSHDVYVFEGGTVAEPFQVDLKPYNQTTIDLLISAGIQDSNLDGYFEFNSLAGFTSSLDIDSFAMGNLPGSLIFDAIKITDVNGSCGGDTPGADIDAVCALSSIKIDCNGILNGTAMMDICGNCLDISDPNFNESCLDCAGVPFGTAVVDDCGTCLAVDDLNFNQACADRQIYIPNIFSPNNDGINDDFRIFKHPDTRATIQQFLIFNRWGALLFEANAFDFDDNSIWWDGIFKGKPVANGIYAFYIEVIFQDGEIRDFEGDVMVVR